jgi:C4-dicarboxylate transporter DctQ subunit
MILVIFAQISLRVIAGMIADIEYGSTFEFLKSVYIPNLPWTEEVARYAMAYLVFVGASIAAKEGAHIGITAFTSRLSPRHERLMRTTAMLIAFIFSVIVFYLSINILQFMMGTGQTSPVLIIPMWWIFAALPIGSALMSIRYLQVAYKQFTQKEERGVE